MEFSHFFSVITASVAIVGIFFKREEILALKNKDYTAKLDSTIRFFKEFYGNNDHRKLVLDRAAQEVVRLDVVDYRLVEYLIILDEQYLINIDEILQHYRNGHKFIEYLPSSEKLSAKSFKLKIKKNRSLKKQIFIYNAQYFIFASLICIPLVFSSWFYNFLTAKNTPFLFVVFTAIYSVFGLLAAVMALFEGTDLNHADQFITKLQNADKQYRFLIIKQKKDTPRVKIPFLNLKIN
ncbi:MULTISPECIES: hypothetical protein [Acinetobacter]|uniref:hypothetical protein n=1 Tax=Acinetobacter TaxID=469 RepID=UPI001651219A|nr:hypothetical protein [Acinetobacter guerrae]